MDYKDFGKKVALLRKSKNISQKEMAEDLNISRATISSLENAKANDIGIKKVLQILDYLDNEIDFKEKSPFPTIEDLQNEE